MEIEIKKDDKFEITGAQVINVLNLLNKLPPSQSGRIFIELQDSFAEQAKSKVEQPAEV